MRSAPRTRRARRSQSSRSAPTRSRWVWPRASPDPADMTGVDDLIVELNAKRLDLLRQAVPKATRVAALVSRSALAGTERAMREVAASTGAELFVFEADGPDDYPAVFTA